MRQILLHVLDGRYADPMALIATTAAQRAAQSTYARTFELCWDPPPDTLFMRATDLDLGVFGEDLPAGHLQMIDANHTRPILEPALERDAPATVAALVAHAGGAATAEEVAHALATGEWWAALGDRRGPILQAAGFARQLLAAVRVAVPDNRAVVWEFTGGRCRY